MKVFGRNSLGLACALAAALALAACGGGNVTQPTGEQPGQGAAGQQTTGVGQGQQGQATPLGGNEQFGGGAEQRPEQNVVYFDFDRSDVKPQYTDLLTRTANYLMAHPNVNVRLEGYTDERGTKAYNLALGDRRAQSVQRFLVLQGVSDGQIKTVSYGEEDPADGDHDEAAWAKNRRVVVDYLQ